MNKDMAKMIKALRETNNLVSYACSNTGFTRSQHLEWMGDAEYRTAYEDLEEEKKDYIEAKMLQAVENLNAQTLVHMAKTKLKGRGYGTDGEANVDSGDIYIGYDSGDE